MDIMHFYGAFQDTHDKIGYLQQLRKDEAFRGKDINWDNLIYAWQNDDWPFRRPRVKGYD